MDAEQLLGTLIRGALAGRRKRSRGALRFLTGHKHSLLNAGTLITAAGVAWGLYEAATHQATPTPPGGAVPAPGEGAPTGAVPPLPATAAPSGAAGVEVPGVSPDVLRVIRLTIAAARADGTLTPKEEEAILAHARTVGAESIVARELQQPTALAALVAGAPPAQRSDLYTLAFAVARADETVSGGERIFLAQLAHHLQLDAASVSELERSASERIAANASAADA